MNDAVTVGFRRRHLPHWTVADRSYFVTVRLKGSLPVQVIEELYAERETLLAGSPDDVALNEFQALRFARLESMLDAASCGPTFLNIASVATLVANAFTWMEAKKGWIIHALTIMPNHVHVLLRNGRGRNDQLNTDLGVLKGYTAREANRILNRQGILWMDENFDHWCRSDNERAGYLEYIRQNPVKAGLALRAEDWPWTRIK